MTKLQLQANDFEGRVPDSLNRLMESKVALGGTSSRTSTSCAKALTVSLGDNPRLGGCLSASVLHYRSGGAYEDHDTMNMCKTCVQLHYGELHRVGNQVTSS